MNSILLAYQPVSLHPPLSRLHQSRLLPLLYSLLNGYTMFHSHRLLSYIRPTTSALEQPSFVYHSKGTGFLIKSFSVRLHGDYEIRGKEEGHRQSNSGLATLAS